MMSLRSQSFTAMLRAWLARHLASLVNSLGFLSRHALNSALAICMIGFALALPTGLYLLIHNAQIQVEALREPPQIALYLQPGINPQTSRSLANKILQKNPEIALGRIISPAQALDEFRNQAGFAGTLESLTGNNPLPAVVLLQPQYSDPAKLQDLVLALRQYPEVEFVQADVRWLRRLSAILQLAQRGLWMLAVLLATGAILVVANILRLTIESRKEEITISSLFGASDSYIRRPFLYHGALYGFFGALLAITLLLVCKWALAVPLEQLNRLFDSRFSLLSISAEEMLIVLAVGFALGFTGAWLVVSKHLHTLRPK